MTGPLFGDEPEPAPVLSAGQRLTARQKASIAAGVHPLTRLPIHPQAPRDPEPTDRARPFTCGQCAHRVPYRYHDRAYPKCGLVSLAHSEATDCRAWWPACNRFEPTP